MKREIIAYRVPIVDQAHLPVDRNELTGNQTWKFTKGYHPYDLDLWAVQDTRVVNFFTTPPGVGAACDLNDLVQDNDGRWTFIGPTIYEGTAILRRRENSKIVAGFNAFKRPKRLGTGTLLMYVVSERIFKSIRPEDERRVAA